MRKNFTAMMLCTGLFGLMVNKAAVGQEVIKPGHSFRIDGVLQAYQRPIIQNFQVRSGRLYFHVSEGPAANQMPQLLVTGANGGDTTMTPLPTSVSTIAISDAGTLFVHELVKRDVGPPISQIVEYDQAGTPVRHVQTPHGINAFTIRDERVLLGYGDGRIESYDSRMRRRTFATARAAAYQLFEPVATDSLLTIDQAEATFKTVNLSTGAESATVPLSLPEVQRLKQYYAERLAQLDPVFSAPAVRRTPTVGFVVLSSSPW